MPSHVRPDSPPPPMPSPQLVPTPLPSPPLISRRRTSSRRQPHTPSPHFLGPPHLEKRIHTSRSCSTLHTRPDCRNALNGDEFGTGKLSVSPPTTPRSLPIPIPTSSSRRRSHRQSLCFAVPYRSPPPSPTIASPPPPVPPIPAFALGPTDKKPTLHPPQAPPTPVYIPELSISSREPVSKASARKQVRSVIPPRAESGMTCVQFFALRNSTPREIVRTAAV
jgi:hypothetical protein